MPQLGTRGSYDKPGKWIEIDFDFVAFGSNLSFALPLPNLSAILMGAVPCLFGDGHGGLDRRRSRADLTFGSPPSPDALATRFHRLAIRGHTILYFLQVLKNGEMSWPSCCRS